MDICSRNEKLAIRRQRYWLHWHFYCVVAKARLQSNGDTTNRFEATSYDATIVTTMRGIWLATVSRLDWPPVSSVTLVTPPAGPVYNNRRWSTNGSSATSRHQHGLFPGQAGRYALWPSKILPWSDLMTGKIGEIQVTIRCNLCSTKPTSVG